MKRRTFFSKCAGFVAGCMFGVGIVPKAVKLPEMEYGFVCRLVPHKTTLTTETYTAIICNPEDTLVIENFSE